MTGLQIKWISKAMDRESDLTEWEYEFIDNLSEKEDDYALSDKQNSVLNRIQQKLAFE